MPLFSLCFEFLDGGPRLSTRPRGIVRAILMTERTIIPLEEPPIPEFPLSLLVLRPSSLVVGRVVRGVWALTLMAKWQLSINTIPLGVRRMSFWPRVFALAKLPDGELIPR